MRRTCCLCLAMLLLCFAAAAEAVAQQGSTPSTHTQSATPEAAKTEESATPEEPDEEGTTTMVLPPGLEPNPPKPEDLKRDGLTWKGEYELDKLNRPVRDADGKPVPVVYTKKGKRTRPRGVRVPKTHPAQIVAGTLVVDGWASKAQLQYDIQDLRYLYISVPTIGTVIISPYTFPGAKEVRDAFTAAALTVKVDDHEVQLMTDKPILGKSAQPAWIRVDPSFLEDRRGPVFGFGWTPTAPYEWPGAKELGSGGAPPVPVNMRPKLATPVCISQPGKPCGSKPAATSSTGTGQSQE